MVNQKKVIVARNEPNSMFKIHIYEKGLKYWVRKTTMKYTETLETETEIIRNIKGENNPNNISKIYATINNDKKSVITDSDFTYVRIYSVNGEEHIRTVSNNTTRDNIDNLPIF